MIGWQAILTVLLNTQMLISIKFEFLPQNISHSVNKCNCCKSINCASFVGEIVQWNKPFLEL